MLNTGNTFGTSTVSYGHARKVWREIRHVYPAGGNINNIVAWRTAGKSLIPAGTPCKIDTANSTITCYLDSAIDTAATDATDAAAALAALGINGLLQEDVHIGDANSGITAASGTVVYEGEIYEYMLDSDTVSALKSISTIPMIVFVN